METWKSIPNYEGIYEISDLGNVRRLDGVIKAGIRYNPIVKHSGKLLKPGIKANGYYAVSLSYKGKVTEYFIHRLVAEVFLENPNNYKVVNHLDGNKLNNQVTNLEWTTYKGNHWHARKHGLLNNIGKYQNKPLMCVETNVEFENSIHAAQWLIDIKCPRIKSYNIQVISHNIKRCANGKCPRAYEYHWEFVK